MSMPYDKSENGEGGPSNPHGELLESSHRDTCPRCGGLLVFQEFMDVHDDTGIINFYAQHCLLCGEVIDPVILKHRHEIREPERSRGPHRRIIPVPVSLNKDRTRSGRENQSENPRGDVQADQPRDEKSFSHTPPSTDQSTRKENAS